MPPPIAGAKASGASAGHFAPCLRAAEQRLGVRIEIFVPPVDPRPEHVRKQLVVDLAGSVFEVTRATATVVC